MKDNINNIIDPQKNYFIKIGVLSLTILLICLLLIINVTAISIETNQEQTFLVSNSTNESVLIFLNVTSDNPIGQSFLNISNTNGLNYSVDLYLGYNISKNGLYGNTTYYFNVTNATEGNYTLKFGIFENGYFNQITSNNTNYTTYNVTININNSIMQIEQQPQPQEQQTSNGGGGGGSSSGSSGSSTISKLFAEITSNGVSFVPNSSKVSINKLFIATKTNVVNIRINMGHVEAEQISKIAPLEVYEYLQITHSSLSDDVIATARINFYVNNTWLDKHNAESVKLYRYHNSLWQELITAKLNSDEQYTYYISETPGFSYFAIIASEIEISNISESVEGTLIETQTKTSPITGAATGFLSEGNYLVFILAGLILVLFILLLVRIRKLKQNEN